MQVQLAFCGLDWPFVTDVCLFEILAHYHARGNAGIFFSVLWSLQGMDTGVRQGHLNVSSGALVLNE
jgi:hypothetical protein